MSDDSDKSLAAVLGYLVGRPLKLREILEALQMSRSRYYAQMDEKKLINADNLIRAAKNLEINEVDLLVRYELISNESIAAYVEGLASDSPTSLTTRKGVTARMRPRRRLTAKMSPRLDMPPI